MYPSRVMHQLIIWYIKIFKTDQLPKISSILWHHLSPSTMLTPDLWWHATYKSQSFFPMDPEIHKGILIQTSLIEHLWIIIKNALGPWNWLSYIFCVTENRHLSMISLRGSVNRYINMNHNEIIVMSRLILQILASFFSLSINHLRGFWGTDLNYGQQLMDFFQSWTRV